METVGKYLKRERELRNISLAEISRATKIRENVLQAIEEDRYDLLPTPVFLKGFLNAYAKYIGLDPGDVVLRYESDLSELHGYEETGPPAQQRKGWNRGFLLGTIVVVIGIGIILLNPWRKPEDSDESPPMPVEEIVVQKETLPAPDVREQQEATPPVEETIPVVESAPAQPALAERMDEPGETLQRELALQINAVERTWIALQVDSDPPREITMKPGETFSQRADDHIKLKIGNAGGVSVTFNGESLGSLGGTGRIVRLNLTHEGYEFKEKEDFKLHESGDETNSRDEN